MDQGELSCKESFIEGRERSWLVVVLMRGFDDPAFNLSNTSRACRGSAHWNDHHGKAESSPRITPRQMSHS